MSTASERHNVLSALILTDIVKGTKTESEAMVLIESVLLGMMLYYRPNVRHASELLDEITKSVVERMVQST